MRYSPAMLVGLVRAMRPHQWVKNLFVLAPLVFAQELFDAPMALRALAAFGLFCLASSTVYLLNDLGDVEADRAHPVKRNRPIASGAVPERVARNAAFALGATALIGALALHPWGTSAAPIPWFALTIAGYVVLNLAYSARLKRVAYVDVLCIATGFELRVLGGAAAALVPPSAYLIVVTFLLATFLGFGKRMHELRQGEAAHKQRSVLRAYGKSTLTGLLFATGILTLVTYGTYTLDPHTANQLGTKWLILTTPFTAFGVLRFLHLVRGRPHAESPTEEMLRDKPFLANLFLWAGAVLAVIYWS